MYSTAWYNWQGLCFNYMKNDHVQRKLKLYIMECCLRRWYSWAKFVSIYIPCIFYKNRETVSWGIFLKRFLSLVRLKGTVNEKAILVPRVGIDWCPSGNHETNSAVLIRLLIIEAPQKKQCQEWQTHKKKKWERTTVCNINVKYTKYLVYWKFLLCVIYA